MTVLTRPEILKEMSKGHVRISPFSEEQVGPGSIDLTLGNKFRKFIKTRKAVPVTDTIDYTKLTKELTATKIILKPGETILGITNEKIHLHSSLCGLLEGRSRYARLGLMIHITSSFMQPGIDNQEVLEIHNTGPLPLELRAGTRICQLVILRTSGRAKYKGIFSRQVKP